MKAWLAIAVAVLLFSVFWAVRTAQHRGAGVILTGGESDGGQIQEDQHWIVVSNEEYKRKNFVASATGFIVGCCLLIHSVRKERSRTMKRLSPPQKTLYEKYDRLSTFELYVEKARFANLFDSEEKFIISALIEQRHDRRDYWTLFAAIASAATATVGLFLSR